MHGIFGLKTQKTGLGLAVIAIPKPVFCVFRVKIPRTFYFKLTEQSSREKLAVGGFEPEKVRLLYPAPLKNLFCEARPRTSHLHRHNRKTTPRPWNLGRRVMAYTFGNGNGTQRQQNNIPIQERNGHRGWGWINPAFFVWVEKFIFMWYNLFDK